jgi:hypothetical protein
MGNRLLYLQKKTQKLTEEKFPNAVKRADDKIWS